MYNSVVVVVFLSYLLFAHCFNIIQVRLLVLLDDNMAWLLLIVEGCTVPYSCSHPCSCWIAVSFAMFPNVQLNV